MERRGKQLRPKVRLEEEEASRLRGRKNQGIAEV